MLTVSCGKTGRLNCGMLKGAPSIGSICSVNEAAPTLSIDKILFVVVALPDKARNGKNRAINCTL